MNDPRGLTLDTKYGRLYVLPTSGSHVYATTNPGGGKVDELLPWTIRGKEHKFITLHLYRHADGRFHVGSEDASDRSGFYCTTASASARAVIVAEAERVVNALPPSLFDHAAVIDLTEQIERATAKRQDALDEARRQAEEIDRLTRERQNISGAPTITRFKTVE